MAEPTNMDEYEKRLKLGEMVTGYGLDTAMTVPCPFCAAPEWLKFNILEVEKGMAQGATCKECGRSARAIFDRGRSGVSFELVQTGGPDQPEWLEPKMRRV